MTTDTYSIQVAVDSTSAITATRNLTAMEQATGRSERALLGLGNMAKAAGAALLGIGFKNAIDEMASFETKMLQLKSLTDATTQQMKAMEKQARELGATTAFSAQQAAEAQGVLASAGLKTNEILAATPKVLELAAAGSLELSKAAEIATGTMKGLGLELGDLGRINDVFAKTAGDSSTSVKEIGDAMGQIAPIAKNFKIGLETLSASLGILADNQIKGSEAGNNLKSMLVALSNDTKDNVEILKKHGITYSQLNVEVYGLSKVMKVLQNAHLSGAESLKIFGSDAAATGNILASNSTKIDEYAKKLENANGSAKKMADTLNQGLAKAIDSFKGTLSEAALQLGDSGLKGALTDVIQQATGVIAIYEGMGDKFAESNNYTKEQYDNLKSVADELKIVAGAAGGIATLTGAIWAANAAMVAFNIATRANPLIMGATVVAAATGAALAKAKQDIETADNQLKISGNLDDQNKKIKEQTDLLIRMKAYPLTEKGQIQEAEQRLEIMTKQKTILEQTSTPIVQAIEQTKKHTEAAKTNTAVTADSTSKTKTASEAKKEAAKAAKDLAEAERYFNEQLNAQVAAAENAGKLFAAQQQTKLAGIEAEKQSIIDKASIEYEHATSYEEKSRILNESQNATNALLAKEKEIRDALTNQSSETIDAKIAAAQAELDNAGQYNLTLAEQLRLKTEIAGLQTDKAILGETASQQDIKAKSDAEKKANDDRLAAIKAIDDAQTAANTASTAQMAILTANLDAAKEAATGLADAFGSVGSAVGGLGVALASYEKSQAAIADTLQNQLFEYQKLNDGKGDQVKKDKAISDANQKQSQLQVKSYGDMAAAAQGFFKKGTAGYNALGVATKVFRAFEMAQSAISMAKEIANIGTKVGAYVTGLFTQTSTNTASVAPNVAADGLKASAAGTEAVAKASAAPFPIGFATGAAMLAFMLAIGVAMAGSGSSAPTMTGAEYEQKQQDKYSASLKTSVLGKDEYSNSIANSLEIIKNNSSADLDYSLGMLRSMETLNGSMSALVSMTARQLNIDIGQIQSGIKYGTSTSSNSPLGSSDIVNLLVFGLLGGFFTKTTVKKEFAGAGIEFIDQTLGDIVKEGIEGAKTYVNILVTTTKSNFFGLFESVKQQIVTQYKQLDDSVANSISYTITSMYNAIAIASKSTGNVDIIKKLTDYNVSLGKIPLGKDPAKYEEILKTTINNLGDQIAMIDSRFVDFQHIGEGYLETLNRTADGIVVAQQKLAAVGIIAIDYTKIKEKQGDVEAELVRESILATDGLTDVKNIMSNLSGTASELLDALKNLNDIKFGLNKIGLGSVQLTEKMINAAGGLSAFNSSINDFMQSMLSSEELANANASKMQKNLWSLGFINMPKLTSNAQDAIDVYKYIVNEAAKDTTEAGNYILTKLLIMGSDFASVANESAKYVTDATVEINANIKKEQDLIIKSTDQRINILKKLGELDPAAKEEALRIEREKSMQGMDGATASYTQALNMLTDAMAELNSATTELNTAYKSLIAMRDKYANIATTLKSYLDELNNTSSDYDNARTLFLKTSELAKNGNEQALQDMTNVSKAFLSASKTRSDDATKAIQETVSTTKTALQNAYNSLISLRDKFKGISQSLKDYKNEITGAGTPQGSPESVYQSTKKAFEDANILAASGNEQALTNLPSTAKAFLDASLKYNATGAMYQTDYQSVLNALNKATGASDSQIDILTKQLIAAESADNSLVSIDAAALSIDEAIKQYQTALKEQSAIDTTRYEEDKALVAQNVSDALAKTNEQITIMNLQLTAAETANKNLVDLKTSTETVDGSISRLSTAVNTYIAADLTFVAAKQMNVDLLASIKNSIAQSEINIINQQAAAVSAAASAAAAQAQAMAIAAGDTLSLRAFNMDKASMQTVSITGYASGGMASGLSLVGEQGAELVNFNSPANVTSHSQTTGLFDSIGNAIDDQSTLLKEQIIELKALVNLQSNANVALINEMQGMKEELNTISRKAKLEAAA